MDINTNIGYNLKTKDIELKLYEDSKNKKSSLLIIINREKVLNAISLEILKELLNIFDYFKDKNFIRSIVITGSGDKAFIAGADIKSMSEYSPKEAYYYSKKGQELVRCIMNYKKPIIAAVNGYALGGGCEIASACHIRYASKNALFGQPEVKLGIIAGWGGTQNLPKLVGFSNAIDLLVSGKIINAEEGYRIGLVNKIFDQDNLIDEVMNLTRVINQNSPNAISNTLSSVYYSASEEGYDNEAKMFKDSFKHNDSKIGLEAFVNKDKPQF